MSDNNTREKCAVCGAYLFEDDDTVYCPDCGAPHHRECYNSLGHCGLEQFHGTEKSYDKLKSIEKASLDDEETAVPQPEHKKESDDTEGRVKCAMCSEEYDSESRSCPKCGTPNMSRFEGYAPVDFLGGIPADMDLGEGVTAEEAKRFVISNTHRYIPKFASMTFGTKASWNWFAFLFPCEWFLSRKMYKNGIIVGTLNTVFSLFAMPFLYAFNSVSMSTEASGASYVEYYNNVLSTIIENLPTIGVAVFIAAIVGGMLNIALKVVTAIFGDYFYRNHTIETLKRLKQESMDIDTDYRRYGGISLIATIIGFFVMRYLPQLIMLFLI